MDLFAIFAMTLTAVGLVLLLIGTSQHTNLYSARNLFMAAWLYYGFSVGFDLLTGAEIPFTVDELDLMDPLSWPAVAFVMWGYMLCGAAFLATYAAAGRRPSRAVDYRYELRLPPSWFLVGVHVLSAYAFVSIFFSMDRMERIAKAYASTAHKFAFLIVPVVLAMDVIVILTDNGKKARVAWASAVLLSLVTGNRNYVLFAFLVAMFRWRPRLSGWKLAMMATSCGVVLFAFKTAYGIGHGWWLGDRVDLEMIYDNLQFSLSGLDAHASYLIAVFYSQEPSPWWCGRSYLEIPLQLTWPRFLGGYHVSTLAESYIWTYHPRIAERGGAMAFSALAEAWLNFSHVGAVLLGAFWGAVARFFDGRPRGIAFYILLMMIVRLFRSDFATIYKNWGLVWGCLFVLVLGALTVYTLLTQPRGETVGTLASSRPVSGSR